MASEAADRLPRVFADAANRAAAGRPSTLDRLFADHRDELLCVARRVAADDRKAERLTPTQLVREALARLVDRDSLTDRGSVCFRARFAQLARTSLVERARSRRAARANAAAGGDAAAPVSMPAPTPSLAGFDLVQLHEAIEQLATLPGGGAHLARLVDLRVFVGMTIAECALATGLPPRTIDAEWQLARAFLKTRLQASR